MNAQFEVDNPYLLLTPGPLSTSVGVRRAMQRDWCTWDQEYNLLVQEIRERLVKLATTKTDDYTAVLMQGSGSFSVEAVLGTCVPEHGKILIINNGAYGERMVQMAKRLKLNVVELVYAETDIPDLNDIATMLCDAQITHVACVHCETTTGMLNPIQEIGKLVKAKDKIWIVDAMSSFGGIPFDISDWEIDFLISSANKCIQGVPGFGFVLAKREQLESCLGQARSVSLDLYDQWSTMEQQLGKWRFTSPTHVVYAFHHALLELEQEGGINARYQRYLKNQKTLATGMQALGFACVIPQDQYQSPIISTFLYPQQTAFSFDTFYQYLKKAGFVIYPGKISDLACFRIGNIGEVYPEDIERLLHAVAGYQTHISA